MVLMNQRSRFLHFQVDSGKVEASITDKIREYASV